MKKNKKYVDRVYSFFANYTIIGRVMVIGIIGILSSTLLTSFKTDSKDELKILYKAFLLHYRVW